MLSLRRTPVSVTIRTHLAVVVALAGSLSAVPAVTAQSLDAVLQWNRVMLAAIAAPGANPATVFVTRPLAIDERRRLRRRQLVRPGVQSVTQRSCPCRQAHRATRRSPRRRTTCSSRCCPRRRRHSRRPWLPRWRASPSRRPATGRRSARRPPVPRWSCVPTTDGIALRPRSCSQASPATGSRRPGQRGGGVHSLPRRGRIHRAERPSLSDGASAGADERAVRAGSRRDETARLGEQHRAHGRADADGAPVGRRRYVDAVLDGLEPGRRRGRSARGACPGSTRRASSRC